MECGLPKGHPWHATASLPLIGDGRQLTAFCQCGRHPLRKSWCFTRSPSPGAIPEAESASAPFKVFATHTQARSPQNLGQLCVLFRAFRPPPSYCPPQLGPELPQGCARGNCSLSLPTVPLLFVSSGWAGGLVGFQQGWLFIEKQKNLKNFLCIFQTLTC